MYCALSSSLEDQNGNYFENCKVTQPIALVRNRDNQQKLWDISCQLLNVEQFGGL